MKRFIALLLTVPFMLAGISACSVVREPEAPIEHINIVDNATKYLRDEKIRQTGADKLTVFMAQNEYEGAQFILNYPEDVKNVSISVSEMTDEGGNILPLSCAYREHYIKRTNTENYYADALIPLCYDDTNLFDITANQNQGIWITFKSEKEQPAGIYTGKVTVSSDSGTEEIPIEATVWDFAIPTTPSTRTSFELWFDTVWTYLKSKSATEGVDYYKLYQDYYWFLSEYRIISASIPEQYGNAEQFAELAEKYLSDERINIYRIPMSTGNYDENGVLYPWYGGFIDALDARGILDKGFIYTFDEPPVSKYAEITKSFAAVRNYNANAKCLLTMSPRASMYGNLDIWCGVFDAVTNEEAFVRQRQAAGEEVWWYGCITPGAPQPSYMLNAPLICMRLKSWMQKDRNIEGELYWASAINTTWTSELGWAAIRDIWEDPKTIYGDADGFLIYAGAIGDGMVNRNIPVPTIRLETIRDGMEDYEYLVILQDKIQKTLDKYGINDIDADTIMDSYYTPLYTSTGDYDSDPTLMLETRKRIAHDITASDDVIVTSLAAMYNGNADSREVRVYAPIDAAVTIGGNAVTGIDIGNGYGVFSAYYEMTAANNFNDISVTVNGDTYVRTIKTINEYEYRELAYVKTTADTLSLGIPVSDIDTCIALEKNYFEFNYKDIVDTSGKHNTLGVCLDTSRIPDIAKCVMTDYKNSFPLIIMNEELIDGENPENMRQLLTLYAPKNAEVTVNGSAAEHISDGEKYSSFNAYVSFDSTGKHLITVAVTLDGVTETFYRLIYQESDRSAMVLDLDDAEKAAMITEGGLADIDGNSIILHFNSGDASIRGIGFTPEVTNENIGSFKDYTHLVFELTNNSSSYIFPPEVLYMGTNNMADPCTAIYGGLAPGDTITIYATLPISAQVYDMKRIRFRYKDMPESDFDITVSNIRLMNIHETFDRGDYVMLLSHSK